MATVPDPIVESVRGFIDKIRSDVDVKRTFIFGSYAKGNHSPDSDVDVCIVASNVENNFKTMLDIAEKVIDFEYPIEPVVFSEEEFDEEPSFGLLRQIKLTGIEV